MILVKRQEVNTRVPAGTCDVTGAGRAQTHAAFGLLLGVLSFCVALPGCHSKNALHETVGNDTVAVDRISRQIDEPSVEIHTAALSAPPVTVRFRKELDSLTYRDLTVDEVLRIALKNSEVLRELGGTVLTNPDRIQSRYANALRHSDPRFSQEAALSAFDTQLRASSYFSNNDQRYNNPFSAGGTTAFKQDLHEYNLELSKLTASGSRLSLRSTSIHDANNAPGNTFRSAWDTYLEGEIRKPLLQGGGVQFNRIAGPGATEGVYNGVLLARVNSDMDQIDFEIAVRDYVNNVTNAYWDLYFAYRDLDSRSRAMKRALEAWNRIRARQVNDLETGAAEALAREQYYRFKSEVDEALTGRVTLGTRTGNGSTGGTLEAAGGVQVTERRLRLLIGISINDSELIRPADEPTRADMVFDWSIIQQDAIRLRPELRRQQAAIRKREMELLASRNFLNPRLDVVGRYRFRGFGDDLIRTNNNGSVPSSAFRNLSGGDQQEWFVGLEYEVPIGYRKAHLAVRNAEMMLCRERTIQKEQQREVVHNLSNAVADAARAYEAVSNNLNRLLAAREVLKAYEAQDQNDMDIDVDHLLDAQRKLVEAEIRYFRSRTEYAVALKNVHLEKGSLLPYHELYIFDKTPAPDPVPQSPQTLPDGALQPRPYDAPAATDISNEQASADLPADTEAAVPNERQTVPAPTTPGAPTTGSPDIENQPIGNGPPPSPGPTSPKPSSAGSPAPQRAYDNPIRGISHQLFGGVLRGSNR